MATLSYQEFVYALSERVGLRFPNPEKSDEFVDSVKHSSAVESFAYSTFFRAGWNPLAEDAAITLTDTEQKKFMEEFAAEFSAYVSGLEGRHQTHHDFLLARIAAEKDPQARQTLIRELATTPEVALRSPKPFQQDAASGRIVEGGPRFPLDDVRARFEHNFPELSADKRDEIMKALATVATGAGVTAEDVAKATMDAVPATITDRKSYLLRQMAESFVFDTDRFRATQGAWNAISNDRANATRYFGAPNDLNYDATTGWLMLRQHNDRVVPFDMRALRDKGAALDIPDAVRKAAATVTLASTGTIRLNQEAPGDDTTGLEAMDARLRAAHAVNQSKEPSLVLT